MKPFDEYSKQLKNYTLQQQPDPYLPVEEYFTCQVANMGSVMLPLLNGWYVHKDAKLTRYDNGVVAGSLKAAIQECPELVNAHLNQLATEDKDELIASNESQYTDGVP